MIVNPGKIVVFTHTFPISTNNEFTRHVGCWWSQNFTMRFGTTGTEYFSTAKINQSCYKSPLQLISKDIKTLPYIVHWKTKNLNVHLTNINRFEVLRSFFEWMNQKSAMEIVIAQSSHLWLMGMYFISSSYNERTLA